MGQIQDSGHGDGRKEKIPEICHIVRWVWYLNLRVCREVQNGSQIPSLGNTGYIMVLLTRYGKGRNKHFRM